MRARIGYTLMSVLIMAMSVFWAGAIGNTTQNNTTVSSADSFIWQPVTQTSGTVSITDTQQNVWVMHTATSTAALTFALPPNPVDGQRVRITTINGITALGITPAANLLTLVNTLLGGGNVAYVYYKPLNKWIKY